MRKSMMKKVTELFYEQEKNDESILYFILFYYKEMGGERRSPVAPLLIVMCIVWMSYSCMAKMRTHFRTSARI
ncbi:hypothetical protein EUGRSUZ_K03233 [Eucalyptus grandis]|uniref:Uncharacterized protein n=2 Tax=Eucalyptus grandis TaxID=71139 RepID=A0ACC3J0B6_EUCGR|nr:hypothetical protein EUGRSUZ_K03233 [Eucalyptus grandis]